MIRTLHQSFAFKCFAMFAGLNMLAQVFFPTAAWALTSGPAQPEMTSFSPVEASNMVNPFTGDFSQNIHLLTVPGPGGGYPVNLAYNAGVSLEEEASWVGLGWNVNAGAVNRQLRGLPDDFNGDQVIREQTRKPNRTIAVATDLLPANSEIFGFDLGKAKADANAQLYYNNYRGLGYRLGANFTTASGESQKNRFIGSLSFSYDSQTGLGVTPGISYSKIGDEKSHQFFLKASLNSRSGLQGLSLAHRRFEVQSLVVPMFWANTIKVLHRRAYSGPGTSTSFSGGSSVPQLDFPTLGYGFETNLKAGAVIGGTTLDKDVDVSFVSDELATKSIESMAYGYLYSHNRDDKSMMDFNMERNAPVTKSSQVIPLPNFTHDVFNATAQGTGGTYRAQRSDFGTLRHPKVESVPTTSFQIGPEADIGVAEGKGGANGGISLTYSKSGDWFPASRSSVDYVDFKGHDVTANNDNTNLVDPLYEPAYFLASGEQTAEAMNVNPLNDEEPYRFEIAQVMASASPKARIRNMLEGHSPNRAQLAKNYRTERKKRSQLFSYETWRQVDNNSSNRLIQYEGKSYDASDHIHRITVTNPDGRRYIYGEPVYNLAQKNVVFSVEHDYSADPGKEYYQGPYAKLTQYETTSGKEDNSLDNKKGNDHFYSSTQLPPYASSHLITEVLSSDYVDLSSDGPTPDDLGSWTRFEYTTHQDATNPYLWRAPYNSEERQANLMLGNLSDNQDDKASYTFGAKEVKYLSTIETKTHIAYFETSQREDGLPVISENDQKSTATSKRLQKLNTIKLYKKKDPNNPDPNADFLVRTVNFEYSYDLCPGVPNNSGANAGDHPRWGGIADGGVDANHLAGKLTLEKVWFINGDPAHNNVGQLSPYEFDYHACVTAEDVITDPSLVLYNPHPLYNPIYQDGKMDRWGNFQDHNPTTSYRANHESPWTLQRADFNADNACGIGDNVDVEARNAAASAWCLRRIDLPSGGTLEVEYEADDYAYVENKPAMQMCRIVNTGDQSGNLEGGKLNGDNHRIYFQLETPIAVNDNDKQTKLDRYVEGLEQLYFKTYLKLKKLPQGHPGQFDNGVTIDGGYAYDYVEGYAETEVDITAGTGYGFDAVNVCNSGSGDVHRFAWIDIKPVGMGFDLGLGTVNPIRKAGFQYLQLKRPDLFRSPNNTGGNIASALQVVHAAVIVAQIAQENAKMLLGFNRYATTMGYCKEIDLSSTARPSFIRLNAGQSKFGGGHRVKSLKVYDNWHSMSGEDDYHYGQVFEYKLADGSSSGVASYEPLIGGEEIPHRTPIRYSSENLIRRDRALYVEDPVMENFYPAAFVGYSRVEVKNLERSVGGVPVTRTAEGITVNEYYTAKDFPVREDRTGLELKPYNVPIPIPFIGSMNFNNRGVTQGFAIELNDMHGKAKSVATYDYDHDPFTDSPVSKTEYFYHTEDNFSNEQPNYLKNEVEVLYADGDLRTEYLGQTIDFYAHRQENYVLSQSAGLNFNINQLGVVTSVNGVPSFNLSEGLYRSVSTTKVINKTGIVSHIRNTTDGSVVETANLTYDAYTGKPLLTRVSNSYQDPVYSYELSGHWNYPGMEPAYQNIGAEFTNPWAQGDLLHPGDVLLDLNNVPAKYWVSGDSPVALTDENDNNVNQFTSRFVVIRSGHRNQQSVGAGSIVSLEHPIAERQFPLFDTWNQNLGFSPAKSFNVIDCYGGNSTAVTTMISYVDDKLLEFHAPDCNVTVVFPSSLPSNLGLYTLTLFGNRVKASYQNEELWGELRFPLNECWRQCLDGVLNASAATFEHDWDYNYAEAGLDGSINPMLNEFRYGKRGIFRGEGSYAYQASRVQSAYNNNDDQTNLREDGVYDRFVLFNWGTPDLEPWIKATQINQYDPYGYEIEEENALGIPSAALYGYGSSLPTAVGANMHYWEMAFDGFEDYDDYIYTSPGHGRLDLTTSGGVPVISTDHAHTGKASMYVAAGSGNAVTYSVNLNTSNQSFFEFEDDKSYQLSYWVKEGTNSEVLLDVVAFNTSGSSSNLITSSGTGSDLSVIEGWKRVSHTFHMPVGADKLVITLTSAGTECWVDDLRLQPTRSTMTTNVYDPVTLRLVAQLDDRNFATFYNYDLEGVLVQTKKETKRGVVTLQNTRSNTRKALP